MRSVSAEPPRALQDRSRRTHDLIVQAGTELLESGGPEAMTIAGVADRAGVATGSVYRRFGHKGHLLKVVQQQFTWNFVADFESRMARADPFPETAPTQVVEAAVTCLALTFAAHAKLLRVFIVMGITNDAVVEVGSQAARTCGRVFQARIACTENYSGHTDFDQAVDFAYRLLYGSCEHRVIHADWFESTASLPWKRFATEMATTINLYLFGTMPADSDVGVSARQ